MTKPAKISCTNAGVTDGERMVCIITVLCQNENTCIYQHDQLFKTTKLVDLIFFLNCLDANP